MAHRSATLAAASLGLFLSLGTVARAQVVDDDRGDGLFKDTGTAAASGDSFPAYAAFGSDAAPDWAHAPDGSQAPAMLGKRFSVKGCDFRVATTAYSINSYGVAGVSEYQVETARAAPRSVFHSMVGGSVYLSVSADLVVTVEKGDLPACKRAFGHGRRGQIPSLELTAQPAGLANGKRVAPVHVIKPATSDALFINWSADHETLVLTSKEGGDATIESAAVEFRPAAAGGLYLTFSPAWKVVKRPRDQSLVAGSRGD